MGGPLGMWEVTMGGPMGVGGDHGGDLWVCGR